MERLAIIGGASRPIGALQICAAIVALVVIAGAAWSQETATGRPELRFVLFERPSSSSEALSAAAARPEMAHEPGVGGEILFSHWYQGREFDPAQAAPGDRVTIAVNPGESYEVLLRRVSHAADGVTVFWNGVSPDQHLSSAGLQFSRLSPGARPFLVRGWLKLPKQGRRFTLSGIEDGSGLTLVREVKWGTETGTLDNDVIDVGGPFGEDMEAPRLRP